MAPQRTYRIHSTSHRTARVDDIWLAEPSDPDKARTRRILRAELVDNVNSDVERVKATLMHQRRHTSNAPWEDADAFNLTHLKAGQEVRLQLDSADTYALYQELEQLYHITANGIPTGNQTLIVAPEDEVIAVSKNTRSIIGDLLESASDEVWSTLNELRPDLFRTIAVTKLHELREYAVEEFEEHLHADNWAESDWQSFFERNTWIFGYGLSYRFLDSVQAQPHYRGVDLGGHGEQRGDYLTASLADNRFTVLVEIKTPASTLVVSEPYRQGAYMIGKDVSGGVAQIQSNCRSWELTGSRDELNRDRLDRNKINTISPKGILIVGLSKQLDNVSKKTSFELFRRNLINPEIILFDELCQRARHLLLNEGELLNRG